MRHNLWLTLVFALGITILSIAPRAAAAGKIVTLAPNLTELVFDMGFGDRLVGRSSACDYPLAVSEVPVVGTFGRPNVEAVIRSGADAVLLTDAESFAWREPLTRTGITVHILPCESWEEILEAGMTLAEMVGEAEAGRQWQADMRNRKAKLLAEARRLHGRPSVYIEIWNDPMMTVGRGSYIDELISELGAKNIGSALDEKYVQVDQEWVLRQNPDLIVLAYMFETSTPAEQLVERPGWSGLNALQNDHICVVENSDVLLRPGPRILEGMEKMLYCIKTWNQTMERSE